MLAGLSLGGIGAFRLGSLYPDRWSLVWADVGADQTDLIANMTAVPVRAQNAVADPLVSIPLTLVARERLAAAGTVDYASMLQLRTTHQPAVKLAECIYRDGLSRTRLHAPVRVRYTVDPSMFVNDSRTGLHLSYDGAYWVSGMRSADKRRASVDLDTHAFGRQRIAGAVADTLRENVAAGRDFCGPNPDAQGQEAWSEQSRQVRTVRRPAAGLITGVLANLAAVTIDVRTAGLTRYAESLRLHADRAVAVTLVGLRPGTRVRCGQATVTAGSDGRATVRLPAGASTTYVTTAHR
jgi:hypothetical protein